MAEDKYAPKITDNTERVHQLHRELIKQQQEENKKEREEAKKPKAVMKDDKGQPSVVAPLNPDAPQNKPVTETDKPAAQPEKTPATAPVSEAPGGNQAPSGAAVPSQGGPAL